MLHVAPKVDLPTQTSSSSVHLAPPSPSDIGIPSKTFHGYKRESRPTTPTKGETYNDKYVVLYDFGGIDYDAAAKEFNCLLDNLEAAGLHTEVRPGYEQTILVFVKAPSQLLGNTVYKQRVKDWLYAITQSHPGGDKHTVVKAWFEAEDVLALYHLILWPTDLGGAGITPEVGEWENVKAIFPLHNEPVNQSILRHLSKTIMLTAEDFDKIRDLHGSKIAFYFAFIQTYLTFLTFPAITGVFTWLFLPKYSLAYAILTGVWCTVFLEYWKIQEIDLSMRWMVRGVNKVKINRPAFKYDKIIVDENGRTKHYFPKWKQIARQLLQIPFIILATIVLGLMICSVFVVEVLICETYEGPHQFYLEYVPTILLAVAIPRISSSLEGIATALTEYENHRTADEHEMSLTQKLFILSIITNYLPILLTAFVYVPFGDVIIPRVKQLIVHLFPKFAAKLVFRPFASDTDRLRNEVIALTVTGQLSDFFEENILPLIKYKFSDWYREYRRAYTKDTMLLTLVSDDAGEADYLKRVRNQATRSQYNVQEDIAELVLQFGYLALFSPVWPLISMGFLINNWIELRSDFAKICIEHRRPAPTRADGIGPWVTALETLTLLGSISTAAIVHLFGTDTIGAGGWTTLPITIFVSEHLLLMLRALTRWIFERYGSEQIRKERHERYARRLHYLEEIEANKRAGVNLSPAERERRKSVLVASSGSFWTKQVEEGSSAAAGLRLIHLARQWKKSQSNETKVD
ncbi:transmembrane protein 16K [Metarhizium robertsii ARSEF 23]|uniref:Transmembrane protein 16K n=1 Tax=Metarhizium robertsii (strain ARSEF 23 / ATCC MYA-3075) TaxID=655844 RepID=E9F610_METRA|nr:transmembrane protein 16K [Metarhizium robertsii ARSEF 23]EFY96896.2 transmembrane protein 16K [Metarhizium robertsii ARSEF 23]